MNMSPGVFSRCGSFSLSGGPAGAALDARAADDEVRLYETPPLFHTASLRPVRREQNRPLDRPPITPRAATTSPPPFSPRAGVARARLHVRG